MDLNWAHNFEYIKDTLWAILQEAGGIAIFTAICSFFVHKINTRFEKRIENKYDEKLESIKVELDNQREKYKSTLEKKNYVSKKRFDTEFSICREIAVACHKMVNDVYFVYPTFAHVPADPDARKKYEERVYAKAQKSYNSFMELISGSAPFIEKNIYNDLCNLGKLCRENLDTFAYRWDRSFMGDWNTSKEKADLESEAYERTREITDKNELIIEHLRQYFSELDVNE